VASPHLVVEPTAGAAARAAAHLVFDALRTAIDARGRASAAFSGGQTPIPMFEQLARLTLPWERVDLFQVDERVAPDDDPARNRGALQRSLLDHITATAHLMDVTATNLDRAAARYAAELSRYEPLDVVHLGLGDDGHTASWPPGDAVIDQRQRAVAIVGPFNAHVRMTVTPPVIDRSRTIIFLVIGATKAPALSRVLDGDPTLPATRAIRGDTIVVADRAACAVSD
jgi:6-phosphogluconolactonase